MLLHLRNIDTLILKFHICYLKLIFSIQIANTWHMLLQLQHKNYITSYHLLSTSEQILVIQITSSVLQFDMKLRNSSCSLQLISHSIKRRSNNIVRKLEKKKKNKAFQFWLYPWLSEEEMASSLNNLVKSQKSTIQSRELNKTMALSPETGLMKPYCQENTNWGAI